MHRNLFSFQAILLAAAILGIPAPAFTQARVVISQVYGGGGNSGSVYTNDFVELFNAGDQAQDLAGWSVQYSSATGVGAWQVTPLSGTIQPGRYFLIQEAAGTGGTTSLPSPDFAAGSIAMSATAGKIALLSGLAALSGACPTGATDFVGYGAVNCSEGSTTGATPAPALTNTTAGFRAGQGCTDRDQNNLDFTAFTAAPRNSASSPNACISIASVAQPEGNTGITAFNFAVKLNIGAPAAVTFNASTADGTATAPSDYVALANVPLSIAAGQSSTTVAVQVIGDTLVEPDETFTVTLSNMVGAFPTTSVATASAVGTIQNDDVPTPGFAFSPATLPNAAEGSSYSQPLSVTNGAACRFSSSGLLPPGLALNFQGTDNLATLSGVPTLSGGFVFTISAGCSNGSTSQIYSVTVAFACETTQKTSTPIHAVQGSGPTSPLVGQTVEVEGIVVGSFQNVATQLRGFYLQEPAATWDDDVHTSEGIFIFDNGVGVDVNVGDRVRVRGIVDEFASSGSSLTEIGALQNKAFCSSGNPFPRTALTLPLENASDFEQYEGMAVEFTQQLVVTGNFNLGTFGQIDLAPQVLYQPTQSTNRAEWANLADLNARSVIALDDGSNLANASLYPTLFPPGGLSAVNTLRVGDLVNYDPVAKTISPLQGVLDDRFGAYRIQPTAPVAFATGNPRPADIAGGVGGRFRVASANVLNFFTTLGSRGAQTAAEFNRQKAKIAAELTRLNGDVYGLSEVQNFNDGQTGGASNTYTNVAIQAIVDALNDATAPGTFAFIDTLSLGASNGGDAIRNAVVYKPGRLTPVGQPALYYQNDTNRPTLAQTFQPAVGEKADQQTFTLVVNHFRSKSSSCGAGDDSPLQGNCNGTRLSMAKNVAAWLGANPTGDPAGEKIKLLLIGDFNAYLGEDPIQSLAGDGFANLIDAIVGSKAYSYNFGSRAGYLDHAFANPALNPLIENVAEWHINADEPASLEALNSAAKSAAAQTAYFAPDPFAASDHDPIVIGLNPLAGDLNDDGVVDGKDSKLLLSAIGRLAVGGDRRMDLDGDGKITLNDYRLWYKAYRAFAQ